MELSEHLKQTCLDEILRLSKLIYDGIDEAEGCECGHCAEHLVNLFAFTINRLAMILEGTCTISDFHDSMVECPQMIREYYIDLLFEEV